MRDFITGRKVKENGEERVVQLFARWLVSIGFRKDQIQTHPQYFITNPDNPRQKWHIDVAVFEDERHHEDTLLLIAECKQKPIYGQDSGLEQLHRYLRRTRAVVGMKFDGENLDYVFHLPNVGRHFEALADIDVESTPTLAFSRYVRERRKLLQSRPKQKPKYTLRQVAYRVGIEPAYLSKIERGQAPPPSEKVVRALARELEEDEDSLLMRAGRFPEGMKAAALARPKLLAELMNQLKDAPDWTLLEVARRVRDGDW